MIIYIKLMCIWTFTQNYCWLNQILLFTYSLQKVNYNSGHNILELYNILVQVLSTASKMKLYT